MRILALSFGLSSNVLSLFLKVGIGSVRGCADSMTDEVVAEGPQPFEVLSYHVLAVAAAVRAATIAERHDEPGQGTKTDSPSEGDFARPVFSAACRRNFSDQRLISVVSRLPT